MFLFFVELVFWAMPSARAAPGSLHSVAFGEPSPSYPYRNFVFWLKYVLGANVFVFCRIIFRAMPSARATAGSLSLGFCCAKNQALRIPIAGFAKFLRLEIGIDGFGVKKHVAS